MNIEIGLFYIETVKKIVDKQFDKNNKIKRINLLGVDLEDKNRCSIVVDLKNGERVEFLKKEILTRDLDAVNKKVYLI